MTPNELGQMVAQIDENQMTKTLCREIVFVCGSLKQWHNSVEANITCNVNQQVGQHLTFLRVFASSSSLGSALIQSTAKKTTLEGPNLDQLSTNID